MVEKLRKLRSILERNQIFIQFFGDIILGIFAIYIAIKANSIYNNQTEISLKANMPQIQIFTQTPYSYSEELVISNQGGRLSEFESSKVTFYRVKYLKENKILEKDLPIIGYYDGEIITNSTTGILTTYTGYENEKKYLDYFDKVINYYEDKDNKIIDLNLVSYIKVNYKDFLNKNHDEYYMICKSTAQNIDNKEGRKKFDNYYSSKNKININTQSISDINNQIYCEN